MPVTSKTGLFPSSTKPLKLKLKETAPLEMPNAVFPATFALRPFAGIYNPFPYGCSILCNHPTDFEARAIVRRAKDAWATEGKSLIDLEEQAMVNCRVNDDETKADTEKIKRKFCANMLDERFDIDSKLPSDVSIRDLKSRRCLTPDPASLMPVKEKTRLVLDLRRSVSQDTVCWQKDLFANFDSGPAPGDYNISRQHSSANKIATQIKRKKTTVKKSSSSATVSSLKTENSKDLESEGQSSSVSKIPSRISEQEKENARNHCQSRGGSSGSCGEEKLIRRRGKKKRKGKKSGKIWQREGDREFKGIPDPGETQISALGNGSQNGSSRPSLSGEDVPSKGDDAEILRFNNLSSASEVRSEENEKSFLKSDILRQLQRQLDVEDVDAEMSLKRKKILEEAFKYKIRCKKKIMGEEMKLLKREFDFSTGNPEILLTIPRAFTRRSARFELPMDSRLLNELTPFSYVRNYAFPSPARLVLYNHVFNLHKEETDDDEETGRLLMGKNVAECLGDIMGRKLTADEGERFQSLIGWKDDSLLDFRGFSGIGAACERILGPVFCGWKMPGQKEDPRHEIEVADFEALETRLNRTKPSESLTLLLRLIRDS